MLLLANASASVSANPKASGKGKELSRRGVLLQRVLRRRVVLSRAGAGILSEQDAMTLKIAIILIGGFVIGALMVIDHDLREIALALAMLVELMRAS